MFQAFKDDEDPGMEVASFFSLALFAELVVPTLIIQPPADLLTRDHLNLESYNEEEGDGERGGGHGVAKNQRTT